MGERRTFSRMARKQLSSDDRESLITEMLGESTPRHAEKPVRTAKVAKQSFDESLDALAKLDAEFDPDLTEHRLEEAEHRETKELREHNALVEDAIAQIGQVRQS